MTSYFPALNVEALPLHGKTQDERLRFTFTQFERHNKKVRYGRSIIRNPIAAL